MNAKAFTALEWDILHRELTENIRGFHDAGALFMAIGQIASTGGDVCWLADMGRRLALGRIDSLEAEDERLTELQGLPASRAGGARPDLAQKPLVGEIGPKQAEIHPQAENFKTRHAFSTHCDAVKHKEKAE